MKIIENEKCEMKIRRPDGRIETIIHPKISRCNDALLRTVNRAMADAGRGQVISYRNIEAVVEMKEQDYIGRCERCGAPVDSRNDYHQMERGMHAYYCAHCAQVLNAIGQGEITAMDERRCERHDNSPAYKAD